jgi:hypothetical protein
MQRFLELLRRLGIKHLFVLMALASSGLPRLAAGADDSQRRAAFRQGVAAIQAEKWDEALAIYRKLWEEEPTYDVALSLGQVELNLKAFRDAAEHLDFGVRNIPPREEPAVSTRARHMLDLARNEVAAVRIVVDRADAEVLVDGRAVGKSPLKSEVFVDPGPHTIVGRSSGSTPIEQAIQATAGKATTLKLVFGDKSGSAGVTPTSSNGQAGAPPPTTASSALRADAADSGSGGSGLRTAVLISGVAVTAIAAAVTITFAFQGASASSDAEDARARATARYGGDPCSTAAGSTSAECNDLASALDRRSNANGIANAALFVGVVAGVSTVATFLLWPNRRERERALRIVPHAGYARGGAVLTGSF